MGCSETIAYRDNSGIIIQIRKHRGEGERGRERYHSFTHSSPASFQRDLRQETQLEKGRRENDSEVLNCKIRSGMVSSGSKAVDRRLPGNLGDSPPQDEEAKGT